MLGHNRHPVPLALFEGFKKEDVADDVADDFKSALIIAYERALENGISPGFALGAMLDWISLELRRNAAFEGN
jgi:hypothetical protein